MRIVSLAAMLALVAVPATAAAQSFVGRWTATAQAPDGPVSEEITAQRTGEGYTITGKLITEVPPGSPEGGPGYDIVLEGDSFTYKRKVTVPEIGEIVITYSGTVSGDAFTGTADIGGFTLPYNGVRSSRPN